MTTRVRRVGKRHNQTIKATGNSGPFERDEWEAEIVWENRISLRSSRVVARPPRKSPNFFCQRTLEERNCVAANSFLMNVVLLSTRN